MIASVLVELGPWSWIVLGFALLAAEILVPGVFLVWIGLA
ncbi:MAG: NfeD family protein, partial [Nitratireductor sp.]